MPVDSHTLGATKYQVFCTILAAIGSFNFGWNIGSVNIPGDVLQNCVTGRKYYGRFPSCIYVKSGTVWGLVVGCFAIGAIIGAVVSNPIINRKGYKFVLCWFALLNVVGALLLSLTTKIPQFIIGRLVVGIAAGAANNAMATYRILFAITSVFGLINFALFPFAPESPKWLVKNGRIDEAREALQKFRAGADIEGEMNDIIQTDKANRERTADVNVMQVLRGQTPDNLRHQLLCVSALMFFQQLCGINAVIFYSTQIINKSTHDNPANIPTLAQILSFIISVCALIFTFFGMILGAYFGRRTLLMFSHGTMGIFSAIMVAGSVRDITGLVVTMVFLFNAFFNLGVGTIPWAAASEMTPGYAMTAMSAIGTGIGYLFTFVIGVIFPPMQAAWDSWTFFFFMAWNIAAVCFVFLFIPETKDRRIEDTVRVHSVGIHIVVGKKWQVSAASEKDEMARAEAADTGESHVAAGVEA
ncbi:general substrate transporter [Linderina pennispora]|uniref:General substrate transporter n=1 Tax=Linderina pennispora TaxID=61395 RepID=A0A1Y1VXV9_9FUNG|nr:general substrate transporter [Linderina pennispora]ORX66111.1 general substrate transporter [Linderina pennispora]